LRSLADDPTLTTLLATDLVPIAGAKTKSGRSLHDWLLDSRFGELAYCEFRCSWLHEGRPGEATHSFDLGTKTEPTYLSNDYATPPRIGFPVPFVVATLRSAIEGFEQQSLAHGVNPVPPPQLPGIPIDDLDNDDPESGA
jgi:hypothetical protein